MHFLNVSCLEICSMSWNMNKCRSMYCNCSLFEFVSSVYTSHYLAVNTSVQCCSSVYICRISDVAPAWPHALKHLYALHSAEFRLPWLQVRYNYHTARSKTDSHVCYVMFVTICHVWTEVNTCNLDSFLAFLIAFLLSLTPLANPL